MCSQTELLVTEGARSEGNREVELFRMAQRLDEKSLQVPAFQREYIWTGPRLLEWMKTVENGKAIGVLVTYQIKGSGPVFLADGLQRLTATNYFLKNPVGHGRSYGPDQARKYCENFSITVQHRHYEDHEEAMRAFQNLNKGTPTTPAEFHKGEIASSVVGKEAYSRIPQVVATMETQRLGRKSLGRKKRSTQLRDALGLFYQYSNQYEGTTFWQISKEQPNDEGAGDSIESLLMQHLQGWTLQQLKERIGAFGRFLAGEMALLDSLVDETNQRGKAASPTFLRWIMHLAIWRKNNGRPITIYQEFLRSLLLLLNEYNTFTSSFVLPNTTPLFRLTLATDSLSNLARLCEYLDSPLMNQQRRRSTPRVSGYDDSHIVPFSVGGNGQTVAEPAALNRSRGAKPMRISTDNEC